jgi:hypothetical protein
MSFPPREGIEDRFRVADELDTICGQAKFGGYRTAGAAQRLFAMADGLMPRAGLVALRVQVDVAEESGKRVRV